MKYGDDGVTEYEQVISHLSWLWPEIKYKEVDLELLKILNITCLGIISDVDFED
jgi:hypothetical protein